MLYRYLFNEIILVGWVVWCEREPPKEALSGVCVMLPGDILLLLHMCLQEQQGRGSLSLPPSPTFEIRIY